MRSRPVATRSVVASVQSPDHVDAALLGERVEVGGDVVGPEAVGAGLVLRVEPVDEEVADEELVARHVPEEERLPDLAVAAALRELDERAVATLGVEAAVEHLARRRAPSCGSSAPMAFSRSRRWRFSSFVCEKSHAANAA